MRIIGLDLGQRRIGVAAADDRTNVAVPVATVTVEENEVETVTRIVQEQGAGLLVVGLPLSLTGAIGPQAQHVLDVVRELQARLTVPIETWDERLTTAQAGRRSHADRRGRKGHPAAAMRDAAAAAILLQAYLDSRRSPA